MKKNKECYFIIMIRIRTQCGCVRCRKGSFCCFFFLSFISYFYIYLFCLVLLVGLGIFCGVVRCGGSSMFFFFDKMGVVC